jgi:hypothetical protein
MTDPEYADFVAKLRRLWMEEQPPHEFALKGGDPHGGWRCHCRTEDGRCGGEGMVLGVYQ